MRQRETIPLGNSERGQGQQLHGCGLPLGGAQTKRRNFHTQGAETGRGSPGGLLASVPVQPEAGFAPAPSTGALQQFLPDAWASLRVSATYYPRHSDPHRRDQKSNRVEIRLKSDREHVRERQEVKGVQTFCKSDRLRTVELLCVAMEGKGDFGRLEF